MCDRPLTEEKTTLYPQQINSDVKANSSVYYTNHQSLTLSSLSSLFSLLLFVIDVFI